MICGGVKIAGVEELYIPTQLSNVHAHYAWSHLSPLEIVSRDIFHNEPDTILYKAKIPEPAEKILEPLKTKSYHNRLSEINCVL